MEQQGVEERGSRGPAKLQAAAAAAVAAAAAAAAAAACERSEPPHMRCYAVRFDICCMDLTEGGCGCMSDQAVKTPPCAILLAAAQTSGAARLSQWGVSRVYVVCYILAFMLLVLSAAQAMGNLLWLGVLHLALLMGLTFTSQGYVYSLSQCATESAICLCTSEYGRVCAWGCLQSGGSAVMLRVLLHQQHSCFYSMHYHRVNGMYMRTLYTQILCQGP